jgi:mannitol 2-dehydrogenase
MAHRGRVIGSLIDYYGVDELAKVVDKLADPAIRIVTLTITEGGYFIDPATGQLNTDHPILVADAQSPKHPHSVFGTLTSELNNLCINKN